MLLIILYIFLLAIFFIAMYAWMVKKFYWGPDNRPPQPRHPRKRIIKNALTVPPSEPTHKPPNRA